MRLFIFNFRQPTVWWFVGGVVCAALLVCGIRVKGWGIRAPGAGSAMELSADFYLATDDKRPEHYVLYHGLNGTLAAMQRAEVVLLGSSRVQYTFRREWIEPFFDAMGLSFYSLGFRYSEQSGFLESLLDKHRLQPKFALVECHQFFTGGMSEPGSKVVSQRTWQEWTERFEGRLGRLWRATAGRFFPRVFEPYNHWLLGDIYRSVTNGTWAIPREMPSKIPLVVQHAPRPSEAEFREAKRFTQKLQAKGVHVLFVLIPTQGASGASAQSLAKYAGVPLLSAEVPALHTVDHNHLTRDSAERYIAAIQPLLRQQLQRLGHSSPGDKR